MIITAIIVILIVDLVAYRSDNQYKFCAVLLALSAGSFLHWVLKLGFTPALMTGNGLKLFEALFRLLFNISQGGQKLRGDLLTILSMLSCFILGSFATMGLQQFSSDFSLCPLIILHIYQYVLVNDFIPGVRLGLESPPPAPPAPPGPPTPATNTNLTTTQSLNPLQSSRPSSLKLLGGKDDRFSTNTIDQDHESNSLRPTMSVFVNDEEFLLTGEEVGRIEEEVDAQMEYEKYRIQMTDYSPAEYDRMRRDRIQDRASMLIHASLRLNATRGSVSTPGRPSSAIMSSNRNTVRSSAVVRGPSENIDGDQEMARISNAV